MQVEGQDGGASADAVSGSGEKDGLGTGIFPPRWPGIAQGPAFTPWKPPAKPVSECSAALVTTGGVMGKT